MEQIKYFIKLFDIEKEVQKVVEDYDVNRNELFYKLHKKWLSKQYDPDDWCLNQEAKLMTHQELIIDYMIGCSYFCSIDWSGEEYAGEIKKYLNSRIKVMSVTDIKLDDKNLRKSVNRGDVKRGEHIPLLLQLFESQLSKHNLHIVIINLDINDEYIITVIDNNNLKLFDGVSSDNITFELPTLYKLYLDEVDSAKRIMMMHYLKTKLDVDIREVKVLIDTLPTEICCGTKSVIENIQKLLENNGAIKTTIKTYI